MARQAREKSESGIYHVMLRGINHQLIFEDEEDNEKFLSVIKECKAVSEFKLFAYCLMGNHIHLLIKVEKEDLSQIFKRIGGKYVYWYNCKYKKVGHLFQDRFKSEPIEDDKYLLTVVRYIHQNPIKVSLVKRAEDYNYSSYNEYISEGTRVLTDTDFVLQMINKTEFIQFHNQQNDDKCLDIANVKFGLTDEEAKKIIFKLSHCKNVSEFQEMEIAKRAKIIKRLKENGLSIRQISRLTGASKGSVEKY